MFSTTVGEDGQLHVHGTVRGVVRGVAVRGDGRALRLWHIDLYTFMCCGSDALTVSLLGREATSVIWEGRDLDTAVKYTLNWTALKLLERASNA